MINLIIRTFIKDYKNTEDLKVRERYGALAGILGILCNILLFAVKYAVGALTQSISVVADSFNNLSDAGSSVVTLIGFKISGKPADAEHPFGHGRMEYVSSFIVSFLILLMGFELIKSSIGKIINPQELTFSWISVSILLATVAVKFWMAHYNKVIGKKISSTSLIAVSTDSRNDVITTCAAIAALITSKFTSLPVDGIMGTLVALFIIYSGFGLLRETTDELLGESPDKELVKSVEEKILSYDGIEGIHDFMIHSYGVGHCFGSVHAEVSVNSDIMASHDLIDKIERAVKKQFNMILVIHMDPIITDDKRINELRHITADVVADIDSCLSIHDFRVVDGPIRINLIFDVLVPYKYRLTDNELINLITEKLQNIDKKYHTVISVDRTFI